MSDLPPFEPSEAEKADLQNRFVYHPPGKESIRHAHRTINTSMEDLALLVLRHVPPGRERALVLTKLEEARSWANAGIAHNHDAFPED